MTSNQIDYYNARMKARNDRLSRKEQKRHNLATERAQNVSASAAAQQAAASAQQAGIAQKKYQLEWETEYGFPYGTTYEEMNSPGAYQEYDYSNTSTTMMPRGITVPQTFAVKQFQIIKDIEASKSEDAKRTNYYSKSVSDVIKSLGGTYKLVKEVYGQ